MPSHINLEAIATTYNPNALTCPMVVEGMTFDALKYLISAVWPAVWAIDHSQRPAEPARGEPGQVWYLPAHEPKPLSYDQTLLITALVQAQNALLVAAVQHPDYSHSRTRGGQTYIYHRDRKSPSGVICATSGAAEKVDPLIRQHRNNSPLSPTEGLRSAR